MYYKPLKPHDPNCKHNESVTVSKAGYNTVTICNICGHEMHTPFIKDNKYFYNLIRKYNA